MTLIFSSAKDINLLAPQYIKNLRLLNHSVIDYYQSEYYYELNPYEKIIHKFYPDLYYKKSNDILKSLVKQHNPDCVIIFKGVETFPETLSWIKSQGVKLVNYNPDHPFRFVSKGSGNHNVLNSISIFDLHITYSKSIANELKEKFKDVKVEILPFGYMISDDEYELVKSEEEVNKVCFIGYADAERAEFIKDILNNDIEVEVFGDNWNRYFLKNNKLLTINPSVKGIEYYRTLRKYRIQLNHFRKHNYGSHNMRSFEVPAVGGIQLAPYSEEHVEFFEGNKEIFFFRNMDELIRKINIISSLTAKESDTIREAARLRSVNSAYHYKGRTLELEKIIKKLLSK